MCDKSQRLILLFILSHETEYFLKKIFFIENSVKETKNI